MRTANTTDELELKLLADDEPEPVDVLRPDGASPFFLTCDHAGRIIPRSLGRLGVPESELDRHIAWDIGIRAVSERIAGALDTTVIMQVYSRLVIDCNRDPLVPSSIPEISELTPIPGNVELSTRRTDAPASANFRALPCAARAAAGGAGGGGKGNGDRLDAQLHADLQGCVAAVARRGALQPRQGAGRIFLDLLRREEGLVVGDNEPYFVSDLTDYTIPVHGEKRSLPHVEIEIRQDLITEEAGQREWADRFIRLLPEAHKRLKD